MAICLPPTGFTKSQSAFDRSRSPSPNPPRILEQSALLHTPSQNGTSEDTTTTTNNNDEKSQVPTSPPPPSPAKVEEDPIAKAKRSAEKLRHIINELIDTEKGYVNDLRVLTTRFLVPLKRAALIPDDQVGESISFYGGISMI